MEELETRFDKWLYVLKNLMRLQSIPDRFQEKIFTKLFAAAEIAQFTREEHRNYEISLKYYRDLNNSIDTAREEGEHNKALNVAKTLKQAGVDTSLIIEVTGLSATEIDHL